jgi:hypothetical protein
MQMIKKIIIAIVPLIVFLACDKVKNPIQDPKAFAPAASANCVSPHIVKTNSLTMNCRKVLIEDYTGHTCGNCPRAAENATTIINMFGDSAVVIAVHAGTQFSPPSLPDYPDDYRTAAGSDWDTFFGMSAAGLPKGCVNRSQNPYPQPRTTWSVTAGNLLNNPQDAKILLTTALDTTKMLVNIDVKTTFLKAFPSTTVNLCVVVTEDSIVSSQKDYSPPSGVTVINGDERPDYEFEHMLRGSVNGSWGVLLKANPVINDTVSTTYNCYQLSPWPVKAGNPHYNLRHTSIVVFIYDISTKAIIQADKIKIW